MTERLYYTDSHMREFTATVLTCERAGERWAVTLDRTAFFPEGGGQEADAGVLGGVRVLDVQESPSGILHYTDAPLEPGQTVNGELDWARRFQNMQSHSGEHVVSGIVHNLFGFDNVGFHMGAEGMIVDFDGYISDEDIRRVELEANRVIWENKSITAGFPTPEELSRMTYRSKKELSGDVRIVTVEGVDRCACCAPHVKSTGEIGLIRIFESIRRKGGVRIRMLAGENAFRESVSRSDSVGAVSRLLSAKPEDIASAVERLLAERDRLGYELGGLKRELIASMAESAAETDKNAVFFRSDFTADDLRLLVNAVLPKCRGVAAAFSGSDAEGYRYVIAASGRDLRAEAKSINAALKGRGGGQPGMIQGSASATEAEIRAYFMG